MNHPVNPNFCQLKCALRWQTSHGSVEAKATKANPQAAELVKLRYFAGCSNAEAASLLNMSPRKANQVWAYARVWLREAIGDDEEA